MTWLLSRPQCWEGGTPIMPCALMPGPWGDRFIWLTLWDSSTLSKRIRTGLQNPASAAELIPPPTLNLDCSLQNIVYFCICTTQFLFTPQGHSTLHVNFKIALTETRASPSQDLSSLIPWWFRMNTFLSRWVFIAGFDFIKIQLKAVKWLHSITF